MQQLEPWSGIGGFLLVIGPIVSALVLLLVLFELKSVTRAIWAVVSQLQAERRELHAFHTDATGEDAIQADLRKRGIKNSAFGR